METSWTQRKVLAHTSEVQTHKCEALTTQTEATGHTNEIMIYTNKALTHERHPGTPKEGKTYIHSSHPWGMCAVPPTSGLP